MARGLSCERSQLGCLDISCGFCRSNGSMGSEKGAEVPQGVWRQVQEEEIHHAPWSLVNSADFGDLKRISITLGLPILP